MLAAKRTSSNLQTIRIKFYILAAIFLFFYALLNSHQDHGLSFVFGAVLGLLMLTTAVFIYFSCQESDEHWGEKVTLFCVMGIAAWALGVNEELLYLIFIVPAYAYLVFDFKKATAALLGFSLIVVYISYQNYPFSRVVIILFSYVSIASLVGIFAFFSERHNQFLRRTLNMDNNLPTYNELQLAKDLDKEIPRADRQGSLFAYITLKFEGKKRISNQNLSEFVKAATDIGRHLRLSDSLYLIQPCHFLVLLAGGDEQDVQDVFQTIQSKKTEFLAHNYSIELHFYHQEDDTQSLLEKIKGHLHAV